MLCVCQGIPLSCGDLSLEKRGMPQKDFKDGSKIAPSVFIWGCGIKKKNHRCAKSVVICWVRRFLSLLYCNLQRRHSWLDRVSCGPLQVEPLWLRTSICCAFLECVIAQRRVSSGPVRGSPRTEQHARVGRWERRKSEWKATLHQTRSLRGTFGRSPIPGRADSRHARGDRREQVNFH